MVSMDHGQGGRRLPQAAACAAEPSSYSSIIASFILSLRPAEEDVRWPIEEVTARTAVRWGLMREASLSKIPTCKYIEFIALASHVITEFDVRALDRSEIGYLSTLQLEFS